MSGARRGSKPSDTDRLKELARRHGVPDPFDPDKPDHLQALVDRIAAMRSRHEAEINRGLGRPPFASEYPVWLQRFAREIDRLAREMPDKWRELVKLGLRREGPSPQSRDGWLTRPETMPIETLVVWLSAVHDAVFVSSNVRARRLLPGPKVERPARWWGYRLRANPLKLRANLLEIASPVENDQRPSAERGRWTRDCSAHVFLREVPKLRVANDADVDAIWLREALELVRMPSPSTRHRSSLGLKEVLHRIYERSQVLAERAERGACLLATEKWASLNDAQKGMLRAVGNGDVPLSVVWEDPELKSARGFYLEEASQEIRRQELQQLGITSFRKTSWVVLRHVLYDAATSVADSSLPEYARDEYFSRNLRRLVRGEGTPDSAFAEVVKTLEARNFMEALLAELWKQCPEECREMKLPIPPGGEGTAHGAVQSGETTKPGEGKGGDRRTDEYTVTEAAEKFDIPKSAWTKAAKQAPETYGYLPTREVGRNRFVRKMHAEKFARDYLARREQKAVGTKSNDPDKGIAVSALKNLKKNAKPRSARK